MQERTRLAEELHDTVSQNLTGVTMELRAVGKLKPDVVVMDLQMPVMDGVEATVALRSAVPTAKVLVLTSFTTADGIAHALAAGARGAITKTAEEETLVSAIRRVAVGVNEHVNAILAKIGSANRTEAVTIAIRKHLVKL